MSQADDRHSNGGQGRRDLHRHERVWDLLPWYVNGTLAAAERAAVEDHLAACPQCRQETESCRRIGAMVGAVEEVAPSPHPVQLARLLSRVEQAEAAGGLPRRAPDSPPAPDAPGALAALAATSEAGAASRGPSPGSSAGGWPGGGPRRLGRRLLGTLAVTPLPVRWALAAQMSLLVVLAGGFAWRQAHVAPPAIYEVQSEPGPPPTLAASAHGRQLRVVFAEDATERQIRDLLLRIRGRVTGGPSPLGAYTVEIPAAGGAADPPAVVVAFLRAQPAVRFVEPVASAGRE
jgi:anti-sigma factor RsiW